MRTPQAMAMVTIAAILAMVIGCATIGGPTPDEEVAAAIADFQAAIKAQDLEKIIESYSDDFTNSQGVNKSMVRGMFEGMASQGTLQSLTVVGLEECEVVVDGNSATVTPLIVDSPMGKISYRCTLKKEADGVWRFVSAEQIN